MKHAIIVAHPDPRSFTMSAAQTYHDAVRAMGHQAIVRDLYRMKFDPCLGQEERPDTTGFEPRADVIAEQQALADADVFAFFYPLWFNSPPAIMKGYMERVFGTAFGHALLNEQDRAPRFAGRQMVSFTSSGSRGAWLAEQGVWASMQALFDDYFAKVCGFKLREHVHFDSVSQNMDTRWVEENLERVRTKARVLFAEAP